MFVLQPNPTFDYPVDISIPGGDAKPITFVFKYRDAESLLAFMESMTADTKKPRKDIDILMDMIGGWKDVDSEFSKENLALLIKNYPLAKQEIFNGYLDAFYKGKEKN